MALGRWRPTDLANLALVCRAHHRAVHDGGWQPTRGPDGQLKVSGPIDRIRRIDDNRVPA